MAVQFITTEDLNTFKQELLDNFKELLIEHPPLPRKWMKSRDVRRLLDISPGTLQNMRVSGALPHAKIGGVFYYAYEDILRLLEDNKKNGEGPDLS